MTPAGPALALKRGSSWADAWQRCRTVAPEAFRDDRVLNLWDAAWRADGRVLPATSPVDGTPVTGPPRLDGTTAHRAVRASLDQHRAWRHVPLPERRARVAATLDALVRHRELLALLLVWEIGKPWRLAQADVDRAVDGVRWYLDGIDGMLEERAPLDGPVSNIASWNYPMSVLVHAMLVQALAGNAVVAKTPPTAASPASPSPARSPPAKGFPSPSSAAPAANCPRPWSGRRRSAASPSSAAATPAPPSPSPSPTSANGTSSNRRD